MLVLALRLTPTLMLMSLAAYNKVEHNVIVNATVNCNALVFDNVTAHVAAYGSCYCACYLQ